MKLAERSTATFTNSKLLLLSFGNSGHLYYQPWANEQSYHSDDAALLAKWLRGGMHPSCPNDVALIDAIRGELGE